MLPSSLLVLTLTQGGVAIRMSVNHQSNYLRVYGNQLRRKLEADPSRPRHILTDLGIGYRLVE